MNDKALGVLDIQLSKFVECSKQYQSANDRLLQQFRALLENYKALKCEYESQRASQAISVENVRLLYRFACEALSDHISG